MPPYTAPTCTHSLCRRYMHTCLCHTGPLVPSSRFPTSLRNEGSLFVFSSRLLSSSICDVERSASRKWQCATRNTWSIENDSHCQGCQKGDIKKHKCWSHGYAREACILSPIHAQLNMSSNWIQVNIIPFPSEWEPRVKLQVWSLSVRQYILLAYYPAHFFGAHKKNAVFIPTSKVWSFFLQLYNRMTYRVCSTVCTR